MENAKEPYQAWSRLVAFCVPTFSQDLLLGQQPWGVLLNHFSPRTDMSKVACYVVVSKLADLVAKLLSFDSLLVI